MLPEASFAVNVTCVVPTGNVAGALFVTVGLGSTMSCATADPRNVAIAGVDAGSGLPVVPSESVAGTVSTGGVVSTTSIGERRCARVVVRVGRAAVTVVDPSGMSVPDAGVQVTDHRGRRRRPWQLGSV